ncbi:DNA recombination protein RmuC [Legionella genomosp. 1]|uniref:DNA recombination protein RmuC n=1 Tax=Legionella genomosp. 1 TaxID=1093625 RepID=UPI001056A29E|nr:DNA recombination protein RmuC [Legionella genomosp. 1]
MPDLSYLFSLQGLVYTNLLQLLFLFLLIAQRGKLQRSASLEITELRELFIEQIHQLEMLISENASNSQQRLYELIIQNQLSGQEMITKNIQQQMTDIREQINFSFKQHANGLTSHLHSLTEEIRNHLQQLTQQVNHKLAEGFEKTSSTFTDVVRRLTIIDEAQKKITELSTHVVSLQDVLQDKRSRGAFGEVQLNALIANMLPSTHYQMQYTLSNQKRADCILFLPEPTGQVVIDAKFPLETYQKLINSNCSLTDKKILQQQFRQDVSKHIKDIAEKYIIAGETSDGAMMFIPAEAIFAEIHANYPEVVALSQRLKVWLVSPSTLMAVLTTAKAVLKDDATRKQVHIIQKHLHALADDFQRFEKRMDKLSKHIDQAHQDVDEVSTSARKITQRFQRIESVDLLITEESTE